MKISATPLAGCIVITPRIFNDSRGYFFESFNEAEFNTLIGSNVHFVQDNQSFSTKGVLRGLHLQKGEYAQAKLVRVTQGEVLDIAVDLRKTSPTYGQYYSVKLSADNNQQFFIPRGFAHGFIVLSDTATFQYKCDNYYDKESEGGLHYADPDMNIDWQMPADELIVSDKDVELPFLKDAGDFGF
jgi:dTDP-4-dehydrorhamnose 3,5-epimerase